MKYSYVARQPILDINKNTVAYELLFRDGPKNTFPEIEPEKATNRLLSDQFLGDDYSVIGDKLAFVNFPYRSLINQIPGLFPKEKIVVEILEDCQPTDLLLKAIICLEKKGYKIALDDFVPSPEWRRFLPHIHLIKFDIQIVPIEKAQKFIQKLEGSKIEFLAEKVESHQEYQKAVQAGFHYFQGYFFSKPEIIQKKSIEPSFLTIVQLCKVIAADEVDYREVEHIITGDVTLSYKLLRYVNSSSLLSSPIQSFHQALAYLGEQKLRKFVSLVAVASSDRDKPESLYSLSIQRARFCELISQTACGPNQRSQAFLTGMFSLLDSLLDQPLELIVHSIPIDQAIKSALLERKGVLGDILTMVTAYESADWETAHTLQTKLNLDEDQLVGYYQQSIEWTEELFGVSDI
ncbi:HDOD domain-containing protein [Vibrio sp. TH_r3]|uniref:EAL and HDOD domain-containing protein n=1 Tax=Vibrio sp. TH_r3 TaxID=3082084 RepID=UPI0029543446|nr:HDOD domain-containing protein [Vibrio sp. TH_r3]MDV7103895.1 HDOD domain-containing protein [Vibrio sp. TH_r3]